LTVLVTLGNERIEREEKEIEEKGSARGSGVCPSINMSQYKKNKQVFTITTSFPVEYISSNNLLRVKMIMVHTKNM